MLPSKSERERDIQTDRQTDRDRKNNKMNKGDMATIKFEESGKHNMCGI